MTEQATATNFNLTDKKSAARYLAVNQQGSKLQPEGHYRGQEVIFHVNASSVDEANENVGIALKAIVGELKLPVISGDKTALDQALHRGRNGELVKGSTYRVVVVEQAPNWLRQQIRSAQPEMAATASR